MQILPQLCGYLLFLLHKLRKPQRRLIWVLKGCFTYWKWLTWIFHVIFNFLCVSSKHPGTHLHLQGHWGFFLLHQRGKIKSFFFLPSVAASRPKKEKQDKVCSLLLCFQQNFGFVFCHHSCFSFFFSDFLQLLFGTVNFVPSDKHTK